MMKYIDADYYGYRDEDDGILVPLEAEVEKEGEPGLLSQVTVCSYSDRTCVMYTV